MFTGIVTAIGEVVESERKGPNLKRLAIACPYEAEGIAIGASIACAGVRATALAQSSPEWSSWRMRVPSRSTSTRSRSP